MNRILTCLKSTMKFCETIIQFASSCDSPTHVLLVLHNGGNLEPTPTTLQMHEAYKNAKFQKKINNKHITCWKAISTSRYYLCYKGWNYISIIVGTMWLLNSTCWFWISLNSWPLTTSYLILMSTIGSHWSLNKVCLLVRGNLFNKK